MKLTRLTPMLHVSDIERSLAFYRDGLGFTLVLPEAAVMLTFGQDTDEPPTPDEN
jgi:catechol 2,3-dioxygenase-like lactoylglutathione lyase family enzyme